MPLPVIPNDEPSMIISSSIIVLLWTLPFAVIDLYANPFFVMSGILPMNISVRFKKARSFAKLFRLFPSVKLVAVSSSLASGNVKERSDIDLFIECKKEELDMHLFEKKLGRKIELHFKENFSLYPKELKNNIINGIVLRGFLEGYK